jgi:hypothetical protein
VGEGGGCTKRLMKSNCDWCEIGREEQQRRCLHVPKSIREEWQDNAPDRCDKEAPKNLTNVPGEFLGDSEKKLPA